ncbi:hypothetical protein [Corynebacterium freiburgense]|uniref:hypothetical protein n=1 Tax=Corynebacterium freiburgense TaxID=556548 RepID=UPI000404E510|nr:hypothetical protein [Corynebacterium freiburgense]WJZ02123.1 hypothetical protein CFREI_04125 [Corynebacterium freiburgense]
MLSLVKDLKRPKFKNRKFVYFCIAATLVCSGQGAAYAQENTDKIIPATEQGFRLNSEEFSRLYGPGVFTHTILGNTVTGIIEDNTRVVSNRFRALHSGNLEAVRLYWPTGTNYSKGTGGKIKISIFPDDGSSAHVPNLQAEPLAVTYFEPHLVNGKPQARGPIMPKLVFETMEQPLVAGELYHIFAENIDANPAENFISTDHSLTHRDNGKPARWLDTTDWATVIGYRKASETGMSYTWKDVTKEGSGDNLFSPIMELTFADGHVQGVFDMESGSVVPDRMSTITATHAVRERFAPSTSKHATGFSVAAAASKPGELAWSIRRNDEILAEGTIEQPEANFRTDATAKNDIGSYTWYDIPLSETVTLNAGETYDLEFRAVGDSEWYIGDHSNGSAYDVAWPAAFTESQAQHIHNGEWINVNHWDHTKPGRGTNWPVVLHLAK